MTRSHDRIVARRLRNQRITSSREPDVAALVAWFGAVQAQDFGASTWAVGLRTRGQASATTVAAAIDEGRILRTHVMRPTWHLVAAGDIRWLLALTAPRVHRALQWGHTQLGTDARLLVRAMKTIERALTAHAALTRRELADHLARTGMPLGGTALALVVMHAELEAVICSGPRRGKQGTYALLDRRVAATTPLSRDEALAQLTTRYFRSHGPATVRDFAWWSGLTATDARRGLDIVRARSETIDGLTYWSVTPSRDAPPAAGVRLLPVYDEYLVAYRDLAAVPRGQTRWGVLPQACVVDGQVAGVWKPTRERDRLVVRVMPERPLGCRERASLEEAVARYGAFHGRPATLRLER